MNIGKIFINNQSNKLNTDNIIDVILEDQHKLVFSPTKNCKYRLFGPSDDNNRLGSMIKDLDKYEIDLYLKYSLINFSSHDIVTKLVVYVTPNDNSSTSSPTDYNYDSFIKNNIILFVYNLNVLDTKYSLKYQQEFALVESEEIYSLDSFKVKYEDEFGNVVKCQKTSNEIEYTDDEYITISAFEWNNAFIQNSFIPKNVTNIGIYTEFTDSVTNTKLDIKLVSLPINYSSCSDDKLYSIGIIGDIRLNYSTVYNNESSETIHFYDLWHSVATLYNKNNCEFVCSTGNLFFPNSITQTGLNIIISKIKYEQLPIYAAVGNYDNALINSAFPDSKRLWFNGFSGGSEMNEDKFFRCPNDLQSFYFLKEVNSTFNKFYDCYIFVSLDYLYYDMHLRPDEKLSDEEYDYRIYNTETINWLMKVLEINKFHRTFVFTNLYFSTKAGNYHNDDRFSSVQIDDERSNILTGSQYRILNELNNRYHNTIWFTGNSEYGFEWQQFDNEIIVCKNDYELDLNNNLYQRLNDDNGQSKPVCTSAYNIHVPGFTNAQEVQNEYNNDTEHISSQSFIMNVYTSYVELIGYIHKKRNDEKIIDQKCPYACYKIDIPGR